MVKRICIIQPVMKQYRIPFFEGLGKCLSQSDISLKVVYGSPWAEEVKRGDNAELAAPLGCKVPTYRLFRKLFVQPSFFSWWKADLVVVEPANKHALNYLLMLLHVIGVKKIAYWGHGYDRQTEPSTLGNRFKRKALHWSNWWFAYTQGAADYLKLEGFDTKRLTIVENAVDTTGLRNILEEIGEDEVVNACKELGWSRQNQVAVFCGSLYENKKLDFLFKSAALVYANNPEFRLLILGGGPMEEEVRSFAGQHEWVSYRGPVFEREKALYLKMADLWVNPGLVGLGILDAFCAGLPLITCDVTFHSPEIEYLEHKGNGLIVEPDEAIYAEAVLHLLSDDKELERLKAGALQASKRYDIGRMVSNFATGVRECLSLS